MRLLKCLLLYSFKWGYRAIKTAEGVRLKRSSKEDGSAKCGFVDHASDLAGLFLQLPLSRALWLCDSPEAHGSVSEPLQVWARWVAEDADLGGAALRLEQLPPGRLQAGEHRGWAPRLRGELAEHPAGQRGREGSDRALQTITYLELMGEVKAARSGASNLGLRFMKFWSCRLPVLTHCAALAMSLGLGVPQFPQQHE